MNYLNLFKTWLQQKNYNPNTVRNYIADIHKYQYYIGAFYPNSSKNDLFIFSDSVLKSYLLKIVGQKNYRRYLTSLSQFFQFAADSKIIPLNPVRSIKKQLLYHKNTYFDNYIQTYHKYLSHRSKTPVTIKNYINDIQQFLDYCQYLKL